VARKRSPVRARLAPLHGVSSIACRPVDDFPPPSRRPLILVGIAIGAAVLFSILHIGFVIRVVVILAVVAALFAWEIHRRDDA
jgi:hypothetical protein